MLRSAIVALAALSGCATIGTAQPASTLGKGNVVGGVEGSLWGLVTADPRLQTRYGVNVIDGLPSVSGVLRFGVSDRVDLGFRAGLNGLELQSKFMFTEPGAKFIVSLAPQLQGFYFPTVTSSSSMTVDHLGVLRVPLPVLFGVRLGNHELVFGARLVNQLAMYRANASSSTVAQYMFGLGASAGVALRFSERFMMIPEIAVQAPILETRPFIHHAFTSYGVGSLQVTAGVACVFGKVGGPQASSPPPEPAPESWDDKPPPPPRPQQPQPPPQEWPDDVAPPPPPPPPPANGA